MPAVTAGFRVSWWYSLAALNVVCFYLLDMLMEVAAFIKG